MRQVFRRHRVLPVLSKNLSQPLTHRSCLLFENLFRISVSKLSLRKICPVTCLDFDLRNRKPVHLPAFLQTCFWCPNLIFFLFRVDDSSVVGEGALDRTQQTDKRASRGFQDITEIGTQSLRMEGRHFRTAENALWRRIFQSGNDFSKRLSLQVTFLQSDQLVGHSNLAKNLCVKKKIKGIPIDRLFGPWALFFNNFCSFFFWT